MLTEALADPPTLILAAPDVNAASPVNPYVFTVTYTDSIAIDVTTVIGNNACLRVTGPGGFNQLATYVSIDNPTDGTPRTATYQITPPGGTWDGSDDGVYIVNVEANEVSDTSGNYAPAGAIGTFTVDIQSIMTIVKTGQGSGVVTSAPAGIDCGADCTEDFIQGSIVTLTAVPGAGSVFTGWSGGGCVGLADCAVTMDQDKTVTAIFEQVPFTPTLTVSKAGGASGTITSSPPGIDCGVDCTLTCNYEDCYTLTAAPDAASALDGWTGTDCPGNGPCNVTMDRVRTITAVFNPDLDGDGISDAVENAGPNNGDGLIDSRQADVATFQDIHGQWCTLVAENGTTLRQVTATVNPSPDDAPEGVTFPCGFFGFTLLGLAPGSSAEVTLILPEMEAGPWYYRYGPTPDQDSNHWYDFSYGGSTGSKISPEPNQILIHLFFLDGGRGDDDLTADGVIVDLGGPAIGGGNSGGGGSGSCFIGTGW